MSGLRNLATRQHVKCESDSKQVQIPTFLACAALFRQFSRCRCRKQTNQRAAQLTGKSYGKIDVDRSVCQMTWNKILKIVAAAFLILWNCRHVVNTRPLTRGHQIWLPGHLVGHSTGPCWPPWICIFVIGSPWANPAPACEFLNLRTKQTSITIYRTKVSY